MNSSGNIRYDAGVLEDKNWVIRENEFLRRELKKIESIFAQGNGYLGQRAALEEKYSTETRGLFLAGMYDRFGEEEVTELPNLADFTNLRIFLDDEEFRMVQGKVIVYSRDLNLRDGIITRHVFWESRNGVNVELIFERFVSLADRHAVVSRVGIKPYNRNIKVRIASGIDGRMTNSGTQHFHEAGQRNYENRLMEYHTVTGESRIQVVQYFGHRLYLGGTEIKPVMIPVMERRYCGMTKEVEVPIGQTLVVDKICSVFTSRDIEAVRNEKIWETSERGSKQALSYLDAGYDELKKRTQKEWQQYWNRFDIHIMGKNDYDQLAIRFALYHLNIMADREDDRVAIAARGLTGEKFRGHCFYDNEIFLLPHYLLTDPKEARRLLTYRGQCLAGAGDKAYRNGYRGAMFPWESAGPGDGEVTPEKGAADPTTGAAYPIFTGKKELHISADISYAVWKYYKVTGDEDFLKEWGYEIILATAVFWADRVEWDNDTVCHIRDVIGPDEYKQRVADNTYTNYMARYNLRLAAEIVEKLQKEDRNFLEQLNNKWEIKEMMPKIRRAAEGLVLPQADEEGIIPQFADYRKLNWFDLEKYKKLGKRGARALLAEYIPKELKEYQVHKQADLVLLMWLFPNLAELTGEEGPDRQKEILEKNYEFYERRTIHDVPQSFATHSLMAATLGRTEEAYELFHLCCDSDMGADGEEAPEGICAANMGGIWQCVVQGFGGVQIQEDELVLEPHLPKEWESLKFRIHYGGIILDINVSHQGLEISNKSAKEISLKCYGEQKRVEGFESVFVEAGK